MDLLTELKQIASDNDGRIYNGGAFVDDYAPEDAEVVHEDTLNKTRWGTLEEIVFKRGNEYVKMTWEEAGGEGETVFMPDFKYVIPVEITRVKYVSPTEVLRKG